MTRLSRLGRIPLPAAMAAVAVTLFATGCPQPPTLTGLNPSSGPPGTVVEIEGDDLTLASVFWDAGSASEQELESSFLSARFFTVPRTASAGSHAVQLSGDGSRSAAVNFTVTGASAPPSPRLDDVTVSLFRIGGGEATMILMAHGANFDVGGDILVGGAAQDTFFSRLLRNTALSDPDTLGYPIHHYGTLWCALDGQTPGGAVQVRVRNENGALSNILNYEIAGSMDELDSDGDGLRDSWEEAGYDADGDGNVDVDLPALGADPLRKDLFVEVDWMNVAAPNTGIWDDIESAFTNAPILNSDGSQGVAIHVDRGAGTGGGGGDTVPYAEFIRYDNATPLSGRTYTNFFTVKSNNFDSDRQDIFRYCVFAYDNGHGAGSSGRADDIPARDFFVSLHNWGSDGDREDFQVGTFLHELGHTINLRHGGFENANTKDNYNSIMQYGNGWITWMGQSNTFGPSQLGGIDTDCDLFDVDAVYTYSTGERADLDEADLDENDGVCGSVAIDWDNDGLIESSVAQNIDSGGSLRVIKDHADWANIEIPLP